MLWYDSWREAKCRIFFCLAGWEGEWHGDDPATQRFMLTPDAQPGGSTDEAVQAVVEAREFGTQTEPEEAVRQCDVVVCLWVMPCNVM